MFQDAEHLRSLAIAHYVVGAITGIFACFPLIHMALGVAMLAGKMPGPGTQAGEIELMGWLFLVMGGIFVIGGWLLAVAMFLTGRWLSARRNHTFCFVVACVECLFMPLGTALGIFSLIVLLRPSVKALFAAGPETGVWSAR